MLRFLRVRRLAVIDSVEVEFEPGLKQTNQGALAERATDRLDLGEFVAASKHVEKIHRLSTRSSKHPELVEDDAP